MNQEVTFKALVIRDSTNSFEDIGDVLAVARAEAKKILHSQDNVKVVDLFRAPCGWIAVFEVPERSKPLPKVEGEERYRIGAR